MFPPPTTPSLPPSDPHAAVLQAYLLGPPALRWADTDLAMPRRQARALLYRLAADLRPVSRTDLAYLFWPDIPDKTARRHLTHLLTHLRQALPNPHSLLATPDQVALDSTLIWCDSVSFLQTVSSVDQAQRLDALEQAIALVRGTFLQGVTLPESAEFEVWLNQERARWEQRTLAILAALLDSTTAQRDYPRAIHTAQRALVLDPFAEDIHRHLIGLYAAAGDRTAAMHHFERCRELLDQELGVTPLPETIAAYEQARDGLTHVPSTARRRDLAIFHATAPLTMVLGLPAVATPLIGRESALTTIVEQLTAPTVRLLTVSGPGGVGKTRLALAAATKIHSHFTDGVAVVALAPLADDRGVLGAIAQTLGVHERDDQPLLMRLTALLAPRHMLLLLDNFEHVLAAGPLLAGLLESAAGLTILVTSRVQLRLSGEHVLVVPPLTVPDLASPPLPTDAAAIPALALLLERVQAHTPSFQATPENITALATICQRLDGLPLALELAAARMKLLSPAMLLARLNRRLAVLVRGPRDLPDRQQTLRKTIEWSYRLLPVAEQVLLGRLAVFAGGWTLVAAETVVTAVSELGVSVLDGLHTLLENHLVQRESDATDEPRFTMLETIREYAHEQLEERGEGAAVQRAHATYFRDLVMHEERRIEGPAQASVLALLDHDIHNIRAALLTCQINQRWADSAMILWKLERYWYMRGLNREILHWARQVLNHAEDLSVVLQVEVQKLFGVMLMWAGDFVSARSAMQQSLMLATALNDDINHLRILNNLAILELKQGHVRAGRDYLAQAVDKADALKAEPIRRIRLLNNLGIAELDLGRYAAAQQAFRQAIALCNAGDYMHEIPGLQGNLALIDYYHGQYAAAQAGYEECLRQHRQDHDQAAILSVLINMSMCLLERKSYTQALRSIQEALKLCQTIDDAVSNGEILILQTRLARLEQRWSDADMFVQESIRVLRGLHEQRYLAVGLREASVLALAAGNADAAWNMASESLQLLVTGEIEPEYAPILEVLAALASHAQDLATATRWCAAATRWRERLGTPIPPSGEAMYRKTLARIRTALDPVHVAAAWERGLQHSIHEILQSLPMVGPSARL